MDIQLLKAELNKLLTEHLEPVVEKCDLEGTFPMEAYEAVAKSGFGAVYLPEAYGGADSL
jgi:alkylation response protein AidB-like acyl-CoA dehydrogenase